METETVVVNAPDQIWLCVGNLSDSLTETVEFDELRSGGDISWCNEQHGNETLTEVGNTCRATVLRRMALWVRAVLACPGTGRDQLHKCVGICRRQIAIPPELSARRRSRLLAG